MSLLLLDELGPIVLRERAEQARQLFRNAIVPVYGVLPNHDPSPRALKLVGTAVLITVEGRKYAATAAHVTDELDNGHLWIPRGEDFWQLNGEIIQSAIPPGGRGKDVIDCSWLELSADVVRAFRAVSFVRVNATSFNRDEHSERFYMAYGYPRSKNKKNMSKEVTMQARSYSGCSPEPGEIPESLREQRACHIFVEFAGKTTEGEDGVRRNASSLAGMSGGALIDLGRFSDPNNATPTTAATPLLSGILLEYHKKHRLMVALDIQVLIAAIRRWNNRVSGRLWFPK